jgi:hypothetical protein
MSKTLDRYPLCSGDTTSIEIRIGVQIQPLRNHDANDQNAECNENLELLNFQCSPLIVCPIVYFEQTTAV